MVPGAMDRVVSQLLGSRVVIHNARHTGGGCINETLRIESSEGVFFLKRQAHTPDLFEKEMLGLHWLSEHSPLRTPKVIGQCRADGAYYLLMEFISSGIVSSGFWEHFGQSLAAQHRHTAPFFGLDYDNHIGRLPQKNERHTDWHTFFIECRLLPQMELAKNMGMLDADDLQRFEKLFPQLSSLFPTEPAAALHGDLWSGNFMADEQGQPCVFDPAVYFGHREAELAFTQLFGGVDPAFYAAYEEAWPLVPEFDARAELYNLYPLLVHVNLFGAGYLAGIRRTLRRFT